MTAATPPLNPRVLALAHYAARGLLEKVLAGHGITFQQSVTLRLAAVADGPVERERIAADVVDALKIETTEARSVVDELTAAELLTPDGPSTVRITDAGRKLYDTTTAQTAPISARIYAGIPDEDLTVAGRVLTLITRRANAELAATTK